MRLCAAESRIIVPTLKPPGKGANICGPVPDSPDRFGSLSMMRRLVPFLVLMIAAVLWTSASHSAERNLTAADMAKLFLPFGEAMKKVKTDYVEPRDEAGLYAAAEGALRRAFPLGTEVRYTRSDLNSLYDTALEILNDRSSGEADGQIVQVAINGMLSSLDPYSSYLDPAAVREMQTQTRGAFAGIGLEVTMAAGSIKAVSPYEGSPADQAGIRANDVIISIDDATVQGLTLFQAVAKLRGPADSKVKLKIVRPNVEQPIEITIVRQTIQPLTVRSRIEAGDVGYIRIASFNELAKDGFKQAIADISRQVAGDSLKGYVIDLRNNPGGLLDQVIGVADDLLDRGHVVSTHSRDPKDVVSFDARPGELTRGKRIVVLINGGTAAGSEILAGALRDNERATLIGTRSFGKGGVQTIIPLANNYGALRLTTAVYVTPSGKSLQAGGITPDMEVLQDEPATVAAPAGGAGLTERRAGELPPSQSYVPQNADDDKALAAAVNVLHTAPEPAAQEPQEAVPKETLKPASRARPARGR
jgi:carboxyl-terminal processing protease